MALTVDVPQDKIETPHDRDRVSDQYAFQHGSQCLQVSKARRSHEHAMRIGRSVAHYEVTQLSTRRFNHLIYRAGGHTETFSNDLEMVDERLHLSFHLFAIGKHNMWGIGLKRSGRHTVERLLHNAQALPHFFHPNLESRVYVVFRSGR